MGQYLVDTHHISAANPREISSDWQNTENTAHSHLWNLWGVLLHAGGLCVTHAASAMRWLRQNWGDDMLTDPAGHHHDQDASRRFVDTGSVTAG